LLDEAVWVEEALVPVVELVCELVDPPEPFGTLSS